MKNSTFEIKSYNSNSKPSCGSSFTADQEEIDPKRLLEITNNEGKYQKRLLFYFCVVGFFMSSVGNMLPYIFYSPTYYCNDGNGSSFTCSEIIACNTPHGFTTTSDKYSIVDHYSLYCENHSLAVWGKSSVFTFSSIITMIIVITSDYWGRLMIFYASWFAIIIGCLICNFTETYFSKIIGIGFLKTGCYSFFSGIYIYSNEITGKVIRRQIAELF